MAILLLRLKRRTISFEVRHRGKLVVYQFQYFYSTEFLAITIDVTIVRASFAGVTFLTERRL